jgi:hypothetical protein
LIPLFEAEALWECVESSRAMIASLREWDLEAAWRLFCAIDVAGAASSMVPGRPRERIIDRSASLGTLLGSMMFAESY